MLGLLTAPLAAMAQPCFQFTNYQVQANPVPIAANDIDGDGDIDLIVGNQDSNTFSVLLNSGAGVFTPHPTAPTYSMGSGCYGIAAGDLNGDNRPDVVCANYVTASNNLFVRYNLGNGEFGPASIKSAGTGPITPVIIDVDRDGDNDILVTNFLSHSFSVLRNVGPDLFTLGDPVTTGANPQGFVLGNLDSDLLPDAVTADIGAGTISVFHNLGDAAFSPRVPYATGNQPYYPALADLDSDGDLDVAVTIYNGGNAGSVSFFINRGDGAFAPGATVPVANGPLGIVAADVDGDCDVDLMIAHYSADNITVLLNNGVGAFPASAIITAPGAHYGIVTAELDGRPGPDAASAAHATNRATVLLNSCWVIADHPDSRTTCPSDHVTFTVATASNQGGPYLYHWRKGGAPIDAGANPSAATPTLELLDVQHSDNGSYDCVITNACVTIASDPATLRVCTADFNCDPFVNSQDFFDFLAAFFALAPSADINHDTFINSQDFFDFLAAFFAGC